MAIAPCDVDMQRYVGPASYFYCTVMVGTESRRSRLRICPAHREEALYSITARAFTETGVEEAMVTPSDCLICGELAYGLGTAAVFVTAYAPERVDWYARLCARHADAVPADLLLGPPS